MLSVFLMDGTRRDKAEDVNALLQNLMIREEDFNDLIIDEEVTIDGEPALLNVAHVLTNKTFSSLAFEDTMFYAWSLVQKVQF
jgi:hypothetical protein